LPERAPRQRDVVGPSAVHAAELVQAPAQGRGLGDVEVRQLLAGLLELPVSAIDLIAAVGVARDGLGQGRAARQEPVAVDDAGAQARRQLDEVPRDPPPRIVGGPEALARGASGGQRQRALVVGDHERVKRRGQDLRVLELEGVDLAEIVRGRGRDLEGHQVLDAGGDARVLPVVAPPQVHRQLLARRHRGLGQVLGDREPRVGRRAPQIVDELDAQRPPGQGRRGVARELGGRAGAARAAFGLDQELSTRVLGQAQQDLGPAPHRGHRLGPLELPRHRAARHQIVVQRLGGVQAEVGPTAARARGRARHLPRQPAIGVVEGEPGRREELIDRRRRRQPVGGVAHQRVEGVAMPPAGPVHLEERGLGDAVLVVPGDVDQERRHRHAVLDILEGQHQLEVAAAEPAHRQGGRVGRRARGQRVGEGGVAALLVEPHHDAALPRQLAQLGVQAGRHRAEVTHWAPPGRSAPPARALARRRCARG
jgi:hypothetical protein